MKTPHLHPLLRSATAPPHTCRVGPMVFFHPFINASRLINIEKILPEPEEKSAHPGCRNNLHVQQCQFHLCQPLDVINDLLVAPTPSQHVGHITGVESRLVPDVIDPFPGHDQLCPETAQVVLSIRRCFFVVPLSNFCHAHTTIIFRFDSLSTLK